MSDHDPNTSRSPVEGLVRLLDLASDGPSRFRGRTGGGGHRLFGGLVAAQAVVAAARTVEERRLHSLHAYFLRPGRVSVAVDYAVEITKQGRNFAARRVTAAQEGDVIFTLHASFVRAETGIEHQDPMPAAPEPDGVLDWETTRSRFPGEGERARTPGPIEIRVVDPDLPDTGVAQPPSKQIWMRPRGVPPEDPLLHTALLVYASDRTLVSTGARPHALARTRRRAASLDHAMWLHREPRFDDWVLYDVHSPAAHEARALVFGAMYLRDGTRIATVAQEGLIRVR